MVHARTVEHVLTILLGCTCIGIYTTLSPVTLSLYNYAPLGHYIPGHFIPIPLYPRVNVPVQLYPRMNIPVQLNPPLNIPTTLYPQTEYPFVLYVTIAMI